MAGISSKAFGKLGNKLKLTGKELQSIEFSDGSGLETYDFGFRMQDPQIGRWNQIDPLADLFSGISPYNDRENNPTNKYDPDGLAVDDWIKKLDNTVVYDKEVTTQDQAEKKYGKGAEDLGKETELYDATAGKQVHGNSDGTISASQNETLSEVSVTATAKTKESNWYESGGKINWYLGTSASIVEKGSGISRVGSNLSIYTATQTGRVFQGNQYVSTFSASKIGGLVSKVSFFAGVIMDAKGVYTYYKDGANNPNAVHPAKATLNTAVGAYGVWVNPIAGTIYFGVDAFYPGGWKGQAQDQDILIKGNQALDPNWKLYPKDY